MKYLLLALGGYLVYEYFNGAVASTSGPVTSTVVPPLGIQTLQGGATGGPTTNVPIAPISAQPQVSANLATQLQQYASASGLPGLNTDQWLYYFNSITGVPVSGIQTEVMLQTLGLNDANRGQLVPITNFLTALHQSGLGRLRLVN